MEFQLYSIMNLLVWYKLMRNPIVMYLQLLYKRWYTIRKPDLRPCDMINYSIRGKRGGLEKFLLSKVCNCLILMVALAIIAAIRWSNSVNLSHALTFVGTQSKVLIFWIRWKRFVLYWINCLENLLRVEAINRFPFLIPFP